MTQPQTPVFETFTQDEMNNDPLFKPEEKKPDEIWSSRIASVALGTGFRAHRTEGESVRQLKRRINAAAGSPEGGFKTLEWKPEDRNLPDGQPASYRVKVKAIDLKAKAEWEAEQAKKTTTSQNDQGGTVEGQQPTTDENQSDSTPENEPAVAGRRGRS